MPEPVSKYHFPDHASGFKRASLQIESSLEWVPELSLRDANLAPVRAIFSNANVTSRSSLSPAGSVLGPTITKSLYITS